MAQVRQESRPRMTDAMKPLIYAASEGPLSRAQAEAAFAELFEGTATPAQIGGLLMAIARARRIRRGVRRRRPGDARPPAVKVTAPAGAMDIVGTGGDGMGTLNISTADRLRGRGRGRAGGQARQPATSVRNPARPMRCRRWGST